ncbi:hypothetical protein [Actinokineospora iranica]|uniref:4-amino-4-deoxy-L-arabinose transferase n=1 Tax=Actinokineospora iranica TaxID=1271860 RepID=A0A1G6J3E7_9PSEU|nr:hypothetical protein [Actinokineospora iranica]SDC13354.1 hypothetical protein SAMN05216174_101222 [Actinokineospora iranica]
MSTDQRTARTEIAAPAWRERVVLGALWVVGGVPVLLALAEVFRAPRLNFNDFWLVLGMTTRPDGAFDISKTTTLMQGQPMELVSIVYWLDARLFAGSNQALGVFTVLLSLAALAAMAAMLRTRFTGRTRVAVLAGLSALVFSSAAITYFGIGMMGAWWLLGLTPAVIAIAFAHHGRTLPATVFGALACLGHGTGLPVWAALVLVAWLRRDSRWRLLVPAIAGAVTATLWLLAPGGTGPKRPDVIGADTLLATTLATLGKIWSSASPDLAILAGALTAAILAAIATTLAAERLRPAEPTRPHDAGWAGLAAHTAIAAAMIGVSRGGYGTAEGLAPRYAALSLLFTAAVLVLALSRGPRTVRAHAVPITLAVALASYGIGTGNAAETRRQYPFTPTLAVAMRLDAPHMISRNYAYPGHIGILRTLRVYPFTDDFTLGCGGPELGHHIDLATVRDLPGPGAGTTTVGHIETPGGVTGDTDISGWAMINGEQAACVLVVDPAGTVVGGGATGLPRRDIITSGTVWGTGRAGWQAVAKPGTDDGAVLLRHGDTYYRVTSGTEPAP